MASKDLISQINSGERYKEKNFGPLSEFFSRKTLLINNKFLAEFYDEISLAKQDLYNVIGFMPTIEFFHIKSVSLPATYGFGSETHFMHHFATLDQLVPNEDVSIVFEEDQYGTIAKFINWCQRKLVTQEGVMRSKNVYTISNLKVTVTNLQDRAVSQYIYKDIIFQSADTLSVNYDGGEAIQYTITFKCSEIIFMPLVGPAGNVFMSGNPVEKDQELKNMPNA